ncbi:DUF6157 family protein [Nonomuraea basaltis]|uniref:DUF6157 family protein n=1 Tax=Nonomuraea basaltis TaxID=2495887 RepID=UPI00110C5B38|nr:DUF6157 family protein [Nonomuraea basaltis]TMR89147.1 hypothetical protein EJK15_62235 [Nonomuraea basaltis]
MAETDMHYYSTLIAVADDCAASGGVIPSAKGGKKTVAVLQFEMIAGAPHGLTQADVLFETWLLRQDLPEEPSEEKRAELRARFFARSQACMRASPLPKTYGWGLLFDEHGRVALCPRDSAEYAQLVAAESGVTVLKAMRSKRA